MSISNEDTRIIFVGDGSDNSPYAVSFPVELATDIEMFYVTRATGVEVSKVITTNYTLVIASDSGSATLTLVTAQPTADEDMVIRRNQPATQQTTYNNFDGLPAEVTEQDFDRNIKSNLTLQEQLDRAITVAKGHPDADLPITSLNLIANALKLVSVKSDESGFELVSNTDVDAVIGPTPATSTDNAVVRWDGTTGRLVQDSKVIINDTDDVTGMHSLHVAEGASGATPDASADNLILELVGGGGFGIIGQDTDDMRITYSNVTDARVVEMNWVAATDDFFIGTAKVAARTILRADNQVANLTLSGASLSELAAFVLDVDIGGDLDIEGVLIAGSGNNTLTNAVGTIIGTKIDKTIITGQTAKATPVAADTILVSDSADTLNLKKVTLTDLLAGSGGDVSGPGPAVTDEAVAVFDGTGGLTIKQVGVTMSVAGAVAAVTTLTGSGVLSMGSDADGTHILGRAKIGTTISDTMDIAHFDNLTTTNYALRATSVGATKVNSAAGQTTEFAIANVTKLSVSATAITTAGVDLSIGTGGDVTIVGGDLELSAGTAHIINGASGATASTSADETIVETSGTGGLSLLTPDASFSNIYFGSPGDNVGALITWGHTGGTFFVGSHVVGSNTTLQGDNGVANLVLSGAASAELAAFAGDVTIPSGFLNVGAPSELTIAAGVVTATQTNHTIDTEGDAATDDLNTINGGSDGDILILSSAAGTRDPTIKDGAGNMDLAGDFIMGGTNDYIMLIFKAALAGWQELSRSDN